MSPHLSLLGAALTGTCVLSGAGDMGQNQHGHSPQSGWVIPSILPTQGTADPSTIPLSLFCQDGCSFSVFGTSVILTLC